MTRYLGGGANLKPFYTAVPREVLSDKLSNYRTVGVGYEIRNLINQTLCTGRVIGAKVPLINTIPGPTFLGNVAINVEP